MGKANWKNIAIVAAIAIVIIAGGVVSGILIDRKMRETAVPPSGYQVLADSLLRENRELSDSLMALSKRLQNASVTRIIHRTHYDTIVLQTDTTLLLRSLRTIAATPPRPR